MTDLLTILIALSIPFFLAGIIYPFKPFRKRRNALFTLLASFGLLAIFNPSTQPDSTSQAVETKSEEGRQDDIAAVPRPTAPTTRKTSYSWRF